MLKSNKMKDLLRDKIFLQLLKDEKMPKVNTEFLFNPNRKFRFDFAFVKERLAIEIEGGIYGRVVVCNHCKRRVFRKLMNGYKMYVREGMGHSTGTGITKDIEKYNSAASLGWRILRFTPENIHKKETIELIKKAIENKGINYSINERLF